MTIVPTIQVPTADVEKLPQDGVINPPVDKEESELVFDFIENYDAPSAEEILADQGVEKAVPGEQVVEQIEAVKEETVDAKAAPVSQEQPAVAAAPIPSTPASVAPGQAGTQPAAPQDPLAELQVNLEAQRETFIKAAAKSYEDTFTDEDVEEFQLSPKVALSKMGARLHADIAQNVLSMVAQQLPRMIMNTNQVQSVHKQAEDEFYTEYADLKQHQQTVMTVAAVARQMNKDMPAPEFKKLVAGMVRASLGISSPATVVAKAPAKPAPFKPAGNSPQRAASSNIENQWAFIDEIIENDNAGAFDTR